MQNLSDNELDKRFKDAADGFRPAFDPEAWQTMEQQLDRAAGAQGRSFGSRIGRYLPFVLIFLTGSVTGILTWNQFTKNDGKATSNLSTQTKPVQTQTDEGHAMRESDDVTSDPNSNTETDSRLADLAPIQTLKDEQNSVTGTKPEGTSTNVLHVAKEPGTKRTRGEPSATGRISGSAAAKQSEPAAHHELTAVSSSQTDTSPITTDPPTMESVSNGIGGISSEDDDRNQRESDLNIIEGAHSDMESSRGALVDNPANDSTAHVVPSSETASADNESGDARENEERSSLPLNRFSIAAALSPDFSSVNFSAHTRPGINAGLLFEYHISSFISVQSGAILSQKIYSAKNLEYNGYTAEQADGDCRIVDIPVNVIYRLPSRRRYSLYLSAGFSSYLMKKEDYTFMIDSYNGPYEYSRSVRNENNEWFKVANISVGVSRKLSERFFLEAEPFVKLPVSGIGDGKLNVNTLGLFLKLRYSFLQTH